MTTRSEKQPVLTRFVAFYSYKGGVGRTLALANCARALAADGKKVMLLDFDLEAPGLLHFDAFHPKSGDKKPAGFAEYLENCLQNGPPEKLADYIHECKGKTGDKGNIWLMPAGRHGEPGYLSFLNRTTWSDFYTQQNGYKILENLRGHIIARYAPDYVFIDARTGLSEIGGIATHQLADIVALVFNLNEQNLAGAKRVFDSINKHAPLNPSIILIASPVPVMPVDKGTPFAEKMRRIGKDFKGATNADKPLVIPYHPLLAFDDRLLVDDGDIFSSDAPYRRLAETIQKVAVVDATPYLQQMTEPMQQGDWQRVLEIAQLGLVMNPTDIHLLNNLSLAYYFTGSLEKAVATMDEILRQYADSTDTSKQRIVASVLFNKGIALGQLQGPEEEITTYDELVRRFGDSQQLTLQAFVAKALVNKGVRLWQQQKTEEEIAAYDELMRRFGESQELALQEPVSKALRNKGFALGRLQRPEEEIAVYDELMRRFGESQELALQEQVSKALLNKGVAVSRLQRPEEEIAVYDELMRRFGESQELAMQEPVSKALLNKGVALGRLQKPEDEIAVYDELMRRFGESQELALQKQVSKALLNKGVALGRLQRPDDEIAAYGELMRRFGESQELALQEQVANSLINKGNVFRRLQRPEDEIAAYGDLVRRFGESQEPVLREIVANALNSIGYNLLLSAKRCLDDKAQRQALLRKALLNFEKAIVSADKQSRAMILGNQGYTLFLLGQNTESKLPLLEALSLGGTELYEGELADSRMHELPADAEFRALLEQLWLEVESAMPSEDETK